MGPGGRFDQAIPPQKILAPTQIAEARAAVAAYLALVDALKRIYPWVQATVNGLDQDEELPEMLHGWPEENRSVRGAAYSASGGLSNDWGSGVFVSTADEMAVLLRRLDEAGR